MPLALELFDSAHEPAARRFNQRMRAARAPVDFLLPDTAPASHAEDIVSKRQFLVMDGQEARGGAIVQSQPVWVGGETREVWNVQAPLSEGAADAAHSGIALFLMKALLRNNPLIYSVGMGNKGMPYPRLLKALGWDLTPVPFFFRVRNGARFLRNIEALRRDPLKRALCDFGAVSGIGPLAIGAYHWWKSSGSRPEPGGDVVPHVVPQFGEWADEFWMQARPGFSLSIERRADVLKALYPSTTGGLDRVCTPTGWAVTLVSNLRGHHYFGDMRLGTIVDAMSVPGKEHEVLQAAIAALGRRDADLIVSNQTHRAWRQALRQAGFLSAPSNYMVAFSKALAAAVPLPAARERLHVNRGDGDGIVNLTL